LGIKKEQISSMAETKKRIALKPHMEKIRAWVDEGRTDDWIADALGTSASSVQSFRSRNDIYRRERGRLEPERVFEGVLDHGEREGYGMWFDPSVAEDPVWREHWARVKAVVVKVGEDSIVLEADDEEPVSGEDAGTLTTTLTLAEDASPAPETPAVEAPASESLPRERGRVKWFDADKGYGFLVRPSGEDLFVHHSEVEGEASSLSPNLNVEYVVGRNDRGPNARSVRALD
jgi:cold shock CspA family protein